ncbi:natriuretic peptide Oh-NP-like [Symphalangus syndactylus]|uniref:natriuretic peptide Oh-NP-like n=1 Tax=Symphalangus syndactylus TaxID=9590 RepID=UPI003005AB82
MIKRQPPRIPGAGGERVPQPENRSGGGGGGGGTTQRAAERGAGKNYKDITDKTGTESLGFAASPRPPPSPSARKEEPGDGSGDGGRGRRRRRREGTQRRGRAGGGL